MGIELVSGRTFSKAFGVGGVIVNEALMRTIGSDAQRMKGLFRGRPIISVVKEINVPRLPSLRGLTRAKSVEIPVWTAADLGVDEKMVGLAGSYTKVIKIFFPQRISQAEMLQGDLENQVDTLVNRLKDARIV